MILIDATNITIGGGNSLLIYLLEQLQDRDHAALVSEATGLDADERIQFVPHANPLGNRRQTLLEDAVERLNPDTLFCFGNIPPRRRLHVSRTVTFFQNAHLIRELDCHVRYRVKDRLRYYLLRRAIRRWEANTDYWLLQTPHIQRAFTRQYGVDASRTLTLPFFDECELRARTAARAAADLSQRRYDFIYASVGLPHKNHFRLFAAWEILKEKHGITPSLVVTIAPEYRELQARIDALRQRGCQIINRGLLDRDALLDLTSQTKNVIFPSLLETLGLGLIEGALLGCRVLAPEMPYAHDIVVPSLTFDPLSAESIADSARRALESRLPEAETNLTNRIDELLDFFTA